MGERWRIELFGGLRATQGVRVVTHFSTRKAGALLAYLAYYPRRGHTREVLSEMFWPDCEPDAGRHSLRMALTSLRHHLEPPDIAPGAVLVATHTTIALNPAAVTTDVAEFEAALAAAHVRSGAERAALLAEAVDLYPGALLAGYYEDWIFSEERRLNELFFQALTELLSLLEQTGNLPRALCYAQRGVAADPLREGPYRELMRLYAAVDQPAEALRQYYELERILQHELAVEPAAAARTLARDIEERVTRAANRSAVSNKHLAVVATPTPQRVRAAILPRLLPISVVLFDTVTLLLVEIVDSPAQREQNRDTLSARTYYRVLLRRELRRSGGPVGERGDVLSVVFSSARDALTCALAIQRSLSAHSAPADAGAPIPLCISMALHTADVVANSKKSSIAKIDNPIHDAEWGFQCALQLLLNAQGGQMLCSESAAVLFRRDLEPDVHLTDLGLYRLRDVATPERLFQIEYTDMAQRSFPPLKATPLLTGHLPVQLTRFFGRAEEIMQLQNLLQAEGRRLVTLTGAGGSGKTRLALEVARSLVESWHGAVWFVPLAELSDARLIAKAVLATLRLPSAQTIEPMEQIITELARQPTLLVLDNFEQLVDAGAFIVQTLLERVPTLTCLITSRRHLAVEGEREWTVCPLPTPKV